MAKINTLFRKGYLLAGVIMAANMFVVNEMRAMISQGPGENKNGGETYVDENPLNNSYQQMGPNFIPPTHGGGTENNNIQTMGSSGCQGSSMQPVPTGGIPSDQGKRGKFLAYEKYIKKKGFWGKLLSLENYFNFFGTLALSGANNYFKLWDYNAGGYLDLRIGCLGWRSKRLLNHIFQFDINLNIGRGILWSIPHIINLIMIKGSKKGKKAGNFPWFAFFFKDILRGFTSMPLTVHIAKFDFSISISLDSIILAVIDKILELKYKKNLEKIKIKEGEELKDIKNVRPTDNTEDNIKAKENSETSETKAKEQLTEEIKK